MRSAVLTTVLLSFALLAGVAFAVLGLFGALDPVAQWAAEAQRGFQARMATSLRALRASEPGALAALWGLCFAYGFVHAVGPGHGKFLLGAYGAGADVPMRRMMGIGLTASLAQGVCAILLVYGGVLLFDASREALQIASDDWLERASLLAIAAIGLWLVIRGARGLARFATPLPAVALAGQGAQTRQHHGHDHVHDHTGVCRDCGHRHGPDLDEVRRVTSLRDAAFLVGAIAIRPCTGALFVLILTWRMGLVWQGIAGVLAMALGTAAVTLTVAALAVSARNGAMVWAARMGRLRALAPVLEMGAGLAVLLISLSLLKLL